MKIFEDRQFNKQIFRQSSAGTQGSSPEGALYFNSPRGDGGVGASMTHRVPSANGVSRAEIARREMENMVKEQERFSNYLAANLNVQAAPPGEKGSLISAGVINKLLNVRTKKVNEF